MLIRSAAIFLTLGFAVHAFAQTEKTTLKCEQVSVNQFLPINGKPDPVKVEKTTTLATRTSTHEGDFVVYKTEGKQLDEKGQVTSTYTSTRKTKKVVLNDSSYREISDVSITSQYADPDIQPHERQSHHQMVSDYVRQLDGSWQSVKTYQDGIDITGTDGDQVLEAAGGDKYEFEWSMAPQEQPMETGTYKLLSEKSICVTHKE